MQECLKAADELGTYGLSTTVADARFAKPLDTDLVNRLAREHEVVITIEEGAIGGFGSFVLHHLAMSGPLDNGLKIRTMVLPDAFLDHDLPNAQYETAGLNAKHIVATALTRWAATSVQPPGPRVTAEKPNYAARAVIRPRPARGKRMVNSLYSPTSLSTVMPAAVPLRDNDVVADRQAKAGALAGRLRGEERLKQLVSAPREGYRCRCRAHGPRQHRPRSASSP